MIESGHLNAIAFWFDLHLDHEISITSAPACIGLGGEVLADVDGALHEEVGMQQNPVKARGKSTLQNLGRPQEAAMHPPCSYTAPDGRPGSFTPARVSFQQCHSLNCLYWHSRLQYPEHTPSNNFRSRGTLPQLPLSMPQ